MDKQLLEIEPKELIFVFLLKKQCSCSVTLTNNTNQYVAFKVKTTAPKKYCVRPNVGIVMPKSVCDFTVTMQAQREAPPDMICKDKFLIQSTVVSPGTSDEDITAALFVKNSGRYIEENKLKVALVSPPHSPVLSPINGTMNQGIAYNVSIPKEPVISRVGILAPLRTVPEVGESKMINFEDLKPAKDVEWKPRKDMFYAQDLKPKKDAELKPRNDVNVEDIKLTKDAELKPRNDVNVDIKLTKDAELKPRNDVNGEDITKDAELKPRNDVNGEDIKLTKDAELKPRNDVNGEDIKLTKDTEPRNNFVNSKELKPVNDVEAKPMDDIFDIEELKSVKEKEFNALKDGKVKTLKTVEELKFANDVEEIKSKLNDLESKLGKAEATISKLIEERRQSTQERKILQEELALLRKKTNLRRVQVGFPLLFVCMVALVSVFLGQLLPH